MVLRDADTKEKLKALAWDQPKVVEAPVTLIVLADKNGWQAGHPTVEKNWQDPPVAERPGEPLLALPPDHLPEAWQDTD